MKKSKLVRRFNRFVDRTQTNRMIGILLAITLAGTAPMLLVIQYATQASNKINSLKDFAELQAPPKTPILSARRTPQTLIDLTLKVRVAGRLKQLAATLPPESCLEVKTDGELVFQFQPTSSLIPGSNMKLLTAATALEVLGRDRTFSTKIFGDASNSKVNGDLWLVGSGDPLLSTREYPSTEKYPTLYPTYIEGLVDALVAAGVKSIEGGVVGDESLFDRERYSPTWGDGIRGTEAGPLGALMINDANVFESPVKLVNPALSAATEFTRLLKAAGISVRDSPDIGSPKPETPLIASIESAPLRDVVTEMLTNSDNNTAELLLKEIGRVAKGTATRITGLQVIAEKIVEWGLPSGGLALADGSGLDRATKLTCSLITSLLQRSGQQSELVNAMAIAGSTGTLRESFVFSPAAKVLRGKTGTLTGVKTLSGVYPFSKDRSSVFSLLLNGTGVSTSEIYNPIWNSLVGALSLGADAIDIARVTPLNN